jgi:tetratricopeptide (TPR) repeat protein
MEFGGWRWRQLVFMAAAAVSVFYAIASWPNQFIYDDHEVIEKQYPIHRLSDLAEIFREPHYLNYPYYRPITRCTFALQKSIWGDRPRAYHLFNALLAGAVMLGAYGLLRRPGLLLGRTGALIVALWLCAHPAMSECVYPAASGRETLLPALFILLSTWAYLGRGGGMYALAMVFFAVALLCKEQAAVLPGIFFLADVLGIRNAISSSPSPGTPGEGWGEGSFPLHDPRPSPPPSPGVPGEGEGITSPRVSREGVRVFGWIGRYLPPALLLIGYFAVRRAVFGQSTLQWTFWVHPAEPLLSLLYGLQTAVTPFMTLFYEPTLDVWFSRWMCAAAVAALLMLIVLVVRGDGAVRAAGAFWLGWFILLQLPTAHLLKQEAPYSERYVALAILAVPATVAAAASRANHHSVRRAAVLIGCTWVAILARISFLRASFYADEISFCLQWVNTNPDSANAHNGLAYIAQSRHQSATALDEYRIALQLDPDSATAHNNLANLLAEQFNFEEAMGHYEWVLRHDPKDSIAMVGAAQTLGVLAIARHDPALRDRAHALLERAIQLKPNYAQAHYIMGVWEEQFGSPRSAIAEFEKALDLRPDWTDAQKRLDNLRSMESTTRPGG